MFRLIISFMLLFLVACSQDNQSSSSDRSSSSSQQENDTYVPLEYNTDINDDEDDTSSSSIIKDKQYNITPSEINIDSINVSSSVESVGLLENGEMAVPEDFTKTGWFDLGTNPGNRGSAVIAGHVDDKTGPGVFFDLDKLKKDDEIEVIGEDGKKLTFKVVDTEVFHKDNAPIEDIFGYTSRRMLNLITCIGTFDHSIGGRTERLVVYTELVEEDIE
ncbi:hypothetical conserved protein [Oceanobacillus iheyensis HTE831]|uniref:Hypothetical conserved protein n=1 Tax=Oceanobacillus iheyensis (strain DSM 14371 / CIP 107618 / JCM 11309 / KCTC 3954 / HTE831) TaxID=221109 RepID=Q8EN27_OCEIH|nr:class F sortase [Oceanobacillus iheyensis]BAC14619.1 hypothetical conserved protein [Oceanobacillus iheyensis HTE831]